MTIQRPYVARTVVLSRQAASHIERAASFGDGRGGILFGWVDGKTVNVEEAWGVIDFNGAIEVEQLVRRRLADEPRDPYTHDQAVDEGGHRLTYVGEWRTRRNGGSDGMTTADLESVTRRPFNGNRPIAFVLGTRRADGGTRIITTADEPVVIPDAAFIEALARADGWTGEKRYGE